MSFQQTQFLDVIDRDEAERRFRSALDLRALEAERIPLSRALGRVLAERVVAPIDVPGFDRSNMDGFAVRAEDTFGATEDSPRELALEDEILEPGRQPRTIIAPGMAVAIATGGMAPRGADAVVMVEDTDVRGTTLVVRRAVSPGSNLSFTGSDIGRGEIVLRKGETLSSREIGVLAALGLIEVNAVRRPRVAILSTGNEVVAPGEPLPLGCVYDSNAYILAETVRELGGEPVSLGITPDNEEELLQAMRRALECDVVLLSGGTSKGQGDLSYRVVGKLGEPGILVHGVALKPGKPLCLAAVDVAPERRRVPVAILPGFPTSAIFTFREFIAPVIRSLAGSNDSERHGILEARLPIRVRSQIGRTEYDLVGLVPSDGSPGLTAYPMGKGSGSVTTYSRADGFVVIPRHREYLEANTIVDVHLMSTSIRPVDLVVIGSHCPGLDLLLELLDERGVRSKFLVVGSSAGLEAAKRGECDLAGVHLLDPETGAYNEPFLDDRVRLVRGYRRQQGIVFRESDTRFLGDSATEAIQAASSDPECVLINRNRGSGTRLVIDQLLGGARPTGYLSEARSHNAVVAAIASGRADWGVAIRIALPPSEEGQPKLGFLPIQEECYDFVVPVSRWDRPSLAAFRELLTDPRVSTELSEMGFRRDESE